MTSHASTLAALAAADLFAGLDEADLDELAALARPFSLAPQDVLFRQGARADRAYLVASGRLAVHLASGATIVPLAIAEPPDVLAETALAVAGVHSGTAIALEPVTGFELDAADFAVLRKLGRPLASKVLARRMLRTPTAQEDVMLVDAATRIRTKRGSLYFAHQQAVYNVNPAGRGEFSWILRITRGTGRFAGATGYLAGAGNTPPSTGRSTSTYFGEIKLAR